MKNQKLINDPIYGLFRFSHGIIYDVIDHPYFQRLRRIFQMGFTQYVYPGATHSRFQHTIGALHLMENALTTLKLKGVTITEEEEIGASVAILMHDIGHGPFSHALERKLIRVSHEEISIAFMKEMSKCFGDVFKIALDIFENNHPKVFLHQLVSSQLDMDRMDYLNRDSFYSGVVEGKIGYDRITKMLNVHDNKLVIEEKGVFSVENFLSARKMMYWQVYLHKTSVSIECMLVKFVDLITAYIKEGKVSETLCGKNLYYFLQNEIDQEKLTRDQGDILARFSRIDDTDIIMLLKNCQQSDLPLLKFYADSIINRKIFRVEVHSKEISPNIISDLKRKISDIDIFKQYNVDDLILLQIESNRSYNVHKDPIKMLTKQGVMKAITTYDDNTIDTILINKHFLCYPKIIV